ncbi:hypothetical protein HDU76_011962 [Blyttiomyces sp. JEL0837]|nr:hypothetical protein HDU76_011962 [Blyttiomyces sp. JEL0837]
MLIGFTCNVCSTRSHKLMSKYAYQTGVVIIKCDGCKSHHLIADHLGWFDTTQGPLGTVEDIMKRKGETVVRLRLQDVLDADGNVQSEPKAAESGSGELTNDDGLLEWLPKVADKAAFGDSAVLGKKS